MEFRILGPLEASDGRRLIALGGARQRSVLAILLLHGNEVVSTDRLMDDLWGEHPPETAKTALQGYVSRLRKALGPGSSALVTRPPGYVLHVEPGRLDRARFEDLLARARTERSAGNTATAAAHLREALGLWRGPALADLRYEPFAQSEIARLEELRLVALEGRIDLELGLGPGDDLVGELEALVDAHPLRERFRGQLMLALYRAGRQAEALAAYREARRTLVEELGIEPGPELQRLEGDILRQDPALGPSPDASPPDADAPAREVRKTITAVAFALSHAALAGGPLDPEALARVRARSVEAVGAAVERHGGTLAGLTAETLVGIFGVPALHEDDALRALRAAVETLERLPALVEELEGTWRAQLELRTGVVSGEIVDADAVHSPGELLGADVVARAIRLAEQVAAGEIAIAERSRQLADEAIRVEPLGAGEADAAAWRLVELTPGAPAFARRFDAPLVGRKGELAQLRQAFGRSLRDGMPHLVTVLGPAGIGKSRLAGELPALVGAEARVLTGRCLPYGEGITFWPLQEIVHEAAGESPLEAILECLGGDDEAAAITELIAATLGLAEGRTASEEETFWAVCRLVEGIARERPLVVVLEDLHWAERTFLDLVEHLAGRACRAPILIVCLARPDLLERRPHWAGGKPNATSLFLEPLFPDESNSLLDNLLGNVALPAATRARITSAAEGNPLFLEQLLAMATEVGVDGGEIPLPPTIEALLAARLDRLGPGERAVLDRAAIVGKEFPSEAIADLLPAQARASVGRHLEALVHKDLIRPGRGPTGEELFRFRHVLIQQTARGGVPKELRAELHERFARWLVETSGPRITEVEEIVGWHLEQAFRYRDELGPVAEARALAAAAASRLREAGRRARSRGDAPAAANLLRRTAALLAEEDAARREVLTALGGALLEAGELTEAGTVLAQALDASDGAGDGRGSAHVLLQQAFLLLHMGSESSGALRLAERTIPLFEEAGDDEGLAKAYQLIGETELAWGRVAQAEVAWTAGLEHACNRQGRSELLVWLAMVVAFGPMPVEDGFVRLDEILEEGRGDRRVVSATSFARALLVAMEGHFDEARSLIAEGRAIVRELGLRVRAAMAPATFLGRVELLADDPAAAVAAFRAGYEALQEIGEKSFLSTISAELAQALYVQGLHEEAERFTKVSQTAAARDDVVSQIGWRVVRARILAGRDDRVSGRKLATEALALADTTDMPDIRADARVALADVLELSGAGEEAPRVLEEAAGLYGAKGNVVLADRTLARIAGLGARFSG
jgi:predicted ATPase/DNA-binding SARP family transcriptional activator/class 3 adenylate cyclase